MRMRWVMVWLVAAGLMPAVCAAETVKRVGAEGAGAYRSIQAAINSVPEKNAVRVVIEIEPGRYAEQVVITKSKGMITLRGLGEDRAAVWIGGEAKNMEKAWVIVQGDDFRCENVSMEETSGSAAGADQRSALTVTGKRAVFEGCAIKGWHNTLAVGNGAEAYFHFCQVVGIGDTVFGAGTAVLDGCEIQTTGGGTVATPLTPKEVAFGLVFLDCVLKGPAGGRANLMRPWGANGHAAFIRCTMDGAMNPKGWSKWGGREETCRAEEQGCIGMDGKSLDVAGSPPWVRHLTEAEAERYTVRNVFKGWDPHGDGFHVVREVGAKGKPAQE